MKKVVMIAGAVLVVLGMVVGSYAFERHSAASETASALETIDAGLDWDGATPISPEEKLDRMNANLEIWRSEKSQRNTSGLLGMLLLGGGAATAFFGLKRIQ